MTTVIHLRKSFSEWDYEDHEVLDPETGEVDHVVPRRVDGTGRAPRYRWAPETVTDPARRPTSPPPSIHMTRGYLEQLAEVGQYADGKVTLDPPDGQTGSIVYSVGAVAEGGNPDEIPLTLEA